MNIKKKEVYSFFIDMQNFFSPVEFLYTNQDGLLLVTSYLHFIADGST